jgi:hypothetical protein
VSLFGQHHHAGTSSLTDSIGGFVHGVPVPIWVGALGLFAAISTPLVQHLFDRSRDRSKRAADDAKESLDVRRADRRVRADLQIRVRAHLAILQAAIDRGRIDVDRWSTAFESLLARSREADVIDALGPSFELFGTAVHREAVALESARAAVLGETLRVVDAVNLAAVVAGYDPILGTLGEAESVAALESTRRSR